MRKLLYITYYFPPDGGAGTQRGVKFCKHLPFSGGPQGQPASVQAWQPIVLTRAAPAQRGMWDPADPTLLHEVGADATVIRVPAAAAPAGWARHLPAIDVASRWLEPAYEAAARAIAEHDPQAVFISMSPFDLAFLGRRLQMQLRAKVIYDLRDPWALDGWRVRPTRRAWQRDVQVMTETLSSADGVVVNTHDALAALRDAVPALRQRPVTVIPNGYDAEDLAAATAPADAPPPETFCLVHSGALHSRMLYLYRGPLGWLRRWRHHRGEPIVPAGRTPLYLLRAVELLRRQGHALAQRLSIVLVGQADDATRRCVRESGVADLVHLTGYVAHGASVGWLHRAEALFLPLHGLPTGRRSLIVPGKTYEYLATGKPILGCLPAGDARELVMRSGVGFCADPLDAQQIAGALVQLYEAWSQGNFRQPEPPPWVAQYERAALTEQLAAFLTQVCEPEEQAFRHEGAKRHGARHEEEEEIHRRERRARTGRVEI